MRTKPQQLGKNVRQSFAKINEVLQMPDLLEVQKNSYQWLLDKGISEVLQDVSPIVDYSGKYAIEFVGYTLDMDNPKRKTIAECKERDVNYAVPFKVSVRLTNRETGEVKQQEIFMGDFPLMTETGTFVINGAERVAVSQLVRSPGMYYASTVDKSGKNLMTAQIIPYRGAWLEYETDMNDIFYVKIDKNRKIPVTVLIRALEESLSTDTDILATFGDDPKIKQTLAKDDIQAEAEKNHSTPYEEALKEIYKKLRPGEPPLVESAQILLNNLFFDAKRYDLSTVGRYKFDKKVALGRRLAGRKLAGTIVAPLTGEILFEAGKILSFDEAMQIEYAGVNEAYVYVSDEKTIKVFGNGMVDPEKTFGISLREIGINENVKFSMFLDLLEQTGGDIEELRKLAKENAASLSPKHITKDDIYASINYLICLSHGIGVTDDIDHLGNRRVKAVGELLQNQLRIGFSRMDKIIKERMTINDGDKLTPQALINIRPILAAIREFFGSSPLSQFMDQNNPLAELTHKRRLSALGPGGLSRDRASFEVRDVHYTHYGRICPIETPEGPNIGLISYLATYAKINDYGFIEAPYRKIDKATGKVTGIVEYMTADMEDNFVVAQANEPLDEEGRFINKRVLARDRAEIIEVDASVPDYIDVSPKMVISVATGFIPFLENDDNSRALMGSNMQKQAVPLLVTDSPIVGTGMEYKAAIDSGVCVLAKDDGVVTKVTADMITVTDYNGVKHDYPLLKFQRSNQGNCINQNPIVSIGEKVKKGDVLADGPATSQGEIALGKNALIGFMTWEGYNYEDAVLLNENLVRKDVYTSIHIEEYTLEARDTKLGPEEITRELPNVGDDARKNLDERGIICKGTEVHAGDILVGKVTPKGETELTAEEKLLRAIFGEKAREVRDTSMRLPHGESGVVVDVRVRDRDTDPNNELPTGVIQSVRVYIAQKRKISVGDKMAGRHGNKGVVSRILPPEDMPFLEDGTPLDIVLNPLGVPSRMNIGQVLEIHLGIAARTLGVKVMTPAFDGAKESDITEMLTEAGFYRPVFADETLTGKELYEETVDKETGKISHKLLSADKLADKAWVDQLIEERKLKTTSGVLSRPVLRGEALTGKKFYEEIVDAQTGEKSYELVGEDKLTNKAWVAQMVEAKKLRTVDGKRILYDGRTGEPFDNPVTVGIMYYLKLHHLVDDKIHARSTGPYSLVTQQPLGGKAQFGGQRFGEMEVWALEAYGAAYTLQEILTVKSDDVTGRVKTYEAIVKGQNIPTPGVPESFRVLVKELQSLGLDIRVLDEDGEEIELSQIGDNLLDDGRGYAADDDSYVPANADQSITTDDLGPSVLEDGDEDSLNMVSDEEIDEFLANTPDDYDEDEE